MNQSTATKGPQARASRAPGRLRIRRAGDHDRSFAWHAFEDAAMAGCREGPSPEPGELEAEFKAMFDPDRTYVATLGTWDAGWIQFSDEGSDVRVRQLHVVPRCQRMGVASALMKLTAGDARKRGRDLVVEVVPRNAATAAFYAKYGFAHDGSEGDRIRMRLQARR